MIAKPEQHDGAGVCPNCSAELVGTYCAGCGQRQIDLDRPFREIGSEVMEAFFSFDTRIVRTLWPLISRPGFLTIEYMAGRRARYLHPFKLYFAICVALFVVIALTGRSVVTISDSDRTVVAVGATGADDGSAGGRSHEMTVSETVADDSALAGVLAPLVDLAVNDPGRLNRMFSDRLAKSIIVLVPVFALLLRALYWRRSYISELVFSLHLHSFAFLVLLVGVVFDVAIGASEKNGPGGVTAVAAIAVYTFLALRRVQGQGRLATIGKMVLLLVGYILALVVTMVLTLAATAFLL